MNFSDILTILEILISVVVGFYLAHWYNVRDTQHRAVKDYYINLLSNLQVDAEYIFHGVLDSTISGALMLSRIDDLDMALEGFDKDLRRALPIKLKELQVLIGDVMDELTNLNDINNHLNSQHVILGTEDRIVVRQLTKKAHQYFTVYINQININSGHHVWYELKSNFLNSIRYFRDHQVKVPLARALWSLLCAFWTRLLMSIVLVIIIFNIWKSYQRQAYYDEQEKKSLIEWRNGMMIEMKTYNSILKMIKDSIPNVRKEDVKSYYDCTFYRYDSCDSTIYVKVKSH